MAIFFVELNWKIYDVIFFQQWNSKSKRDFLRPFITLEFNFVKGRVNYNIFINFA